MWCAGTLLLPRSYHGCLAAAAVDSGATGGVCVAAVDFCVRRACSDCTWALGRNVEC